MTQSNIRTIRAVLYLRVAPSAQAIVNLAFADQRKQLEAYCQRQGWQVVGEYQEVRNPFRSNRRIIDELVKLSKHEEARFERLVVCSDSDRLREEVEADLTIRALRKRGFGVVIVNQEAFDDHVGEQLRNLTMLFDEHFSRETSNHVKRALRKNAQQGFWCGGPAPYGFRTYVASEPGKPVRKKLEPVPIEAEVIRKMFDLLENGDGKSGPLDVKSITAWLNENGYRTRRGKNWSNGMVQRLLTNSAVKGDYIFGKNEGIERAIQIPTPEIIPAHRFDMAQKILRTRNPRRNPPETSLVRVKK